MPRAERPIEFLGSFETTYQPNHDVDVAESTGHDRWWRDDLALLRATGVERLRYPVRWHRIERHAGDFDWESTDEVMGHLRDNGLRPIVDLVHHTSYPRWLTGGLADPRFGAAYLRFAEKVARRYPWIEEYTLFNEPFSTMFLAGHEAVWPPYHHGLSSFVEMLVNVLPSVAEAGARYRDLLPDARHVYVDTCERHTGSGTAGEQYAALVNDRRFVVLDALLGRFDDGTPRPFVEAALRNGGEALLHLNPIDVDVVGLDYYAHNQWHFTSNGHETPSPRVPPLAELIEEYATRYGRPCMLSETNIRGFASDRASWLKYTLEQCEKAIAAGVELDGYCWFPFIDSCDWDSLLYRCDGNVDPVGVFWLDDDLRRHASSMSASFSRAAHGALSADLPAYELQEPVATWLQGFLPHMSHWDWQPPPREERVASEPRRPIPFEPLRIRDVA